MSAFLSNSTELRQKLTQTYQELPFIPKQIMRLLSVIYEAVSRSEFLKCVNALGLKQENGKAFHAATLKPHLDDLIEKEMILDRIGSRFTVPFFNY